MLRVLLTVLLPLVAPFLIYLGWVWLVRRKTAGGVIALDWREAPLPWLLALGLCSALVGLLYLYVSTGHSPDTKLVPPALVDGVVVPSHPVE
ncbi:MAG: hypothetical protein ACFCUT_10675 [Kiloniellaceae bacterium]